MALSATPTNPLNGIQVSPVAAHASTVCHLSEPSLNRPRHTVR